MLTDTKARQAKPKAKPYKLADQGGLYLFVSLAGAKSWPYDYRLHGRRETLTLGAYPEAKLAEAREHHIEARKRVARGESPSKQKRIEKRAASEAAAGTFEAVARTGMPPRPRTVPGPGDRLHGGGWTRSCIR